MHVVTALDTTVEQLGQHQCFSRIALDNLQLVAVSAVGGYAAISCPRVASGDARASTAACSRGAIPGESVGSGMNL